MSLLGPLWLWVFVILPLGLITAGMWAGAWYVLRAFPVHGLMPLFEHRQLRPQDFAPFGSIHAVTAVSACAPVYAITATSAYAGPIRVVRG